MEKEGMDFIHKRVRACKVVDAGVLVANSCIHFDGIK